MKVKRSHLACSERGKRDNNEDFVLPCPDLNLYIVCDGVGGSARGEVASRLSAEAIRLHFQTQPFDNQSVATYIQTAVAAAELALQQHVEQNPQSAGLGTTLTLLHFHAGGATIAHIGDSRVYHYRRNEDLFVTEDHSLVMDLLKAGWITPEEVRNHPRRNVITRAIQADKRKSVQAAVQVLTDIQIGDQFFLCSDGVTEAFTDEDLKIVFEQSLDNQDFINQIKQKCSEVSNDNYTGLVLRVEGVEGYLAGESHFKSNVEIESAIVPAAEMPLPKANTQVGVEMSTSISISSDSMKPAPKEPQLASAKETRTLIVIIGFAISLIIWATWAHLTQKKTDKTTTETHSSNKPKQDPTKRDVTLSKSKVLEHKHLPVDTIPSAIKKKAELDSLQNARKLDSLMQLKEKANGAFPK